MPTDTLRPNAAASALHRVAAAGPTLCAQAFDALPFSLLLLDGLRRVLQANRRARARLAAADGILEVRGRLSVAGPDRDAFETGWTAMVAEPSSSGRSFFARRSGDTSPLLLDATRIDSDDARIWLLRIADETLSQRRLAADWVMQFGLTASECKVGLALLRHGDAISIAAALRISDNTVRAHLKTLFAKTGVRSQAALVLRLARPAIMVE